MGKLHIYAIGGSGARVVRSLLFLMGGGALKDHTVHINMLDLDNNVKANTDVESLHSLYDNIKKGIGNLGEYNSINIFGSNSVYINGSGYFTDVVRSDFKTFLTGNPENEFSKSHLPNGNLKLLMESLYSTEAAEGGFRELKLPLAQGFYGNPNIGSVVMNHILNDKSFRDSIDGIQTDDKVFLIGSIFGGTGAAGYPSLVRILKTYNKCEKLGSLLFLPYFKLGNINSNQTIIDKEWKAKTKTALSYYLYDELIKAKVKSKYYIGDENGRTFQYNPGGALQNNPAGIVELIGAFSILHFMSNEQTANEEYGFFMKNKTTEQPNLVGVFKGDDLITFKNFFESSNNNDYNLYIKPLLRLGILNKIFQTLNTVPNNYKDRSFISRSNYFEKSTDPNDNIRNLWINIQQFTSYFQVFFEELNDRGVESTSGRQGKFFEFNGDFVSLLNQIEIDLKEHGNFEGILKSSLHNKNIDSKNLNDNQKLLAVINYIIDIEIIPFINVTTYN